MVIVKLLDLISVIVVKSLLKSQENCLHPKIYQSQENQKAKSWLNPKIC